MKKCPLDYTRSTADPICFDHVLHSELQEVKGSIFQGHLNPIHIEHEAIQSLRTILQTSLGSKSDHILYAYKITFYNLPTKKLVTRALNCCFEISMLSTMLHKCVITSIPKGNKNRTQLQNWRPVYFLCVTYKHASGAMANRLKQTLRHIISQSPWIYRRKANK